MKKIFIMILFVSIFIGFVKADEKDFVIVYTADSHAALFPCDCPLEPDGGLARRATLIKQIRKENPEKVLLIDGGGFTAGGVYDEYTKGHDIDKLRSEIIVKAMEKLKYDAVTIGDDDLNLGLKFVEESPLPLLSSNLYKSTTGKPHSLKNPFIIKEINGTKIAIIGLTTADRPLIKDQDARARTFVLAPIETLRKHIKIVKDKGAEYIIVASHSGYNVNKKIAEEVKGVDLILNAHRRITRSDREEINGVPLIQFHHQTKKLAVIKVNKNKVDLEVKRLSKDVPDDPEITELVKNSFKIKAVNEKGIVKATLFKMAYCPYSEIVEKSLIKLKEKLGDKLNIELKFVVSLDKKGKLDSLHGEEETYENMRQVCLQKFYPEKVMDYLAWRHKRKYIVKEEEENKTEKEVIEIRNNKIKEYFKSEGISIARINGCIKSGEGEQMLKDDVFLCDRLNVTGSPTLYFNNQKYDNTLGYKELRLLRQICNTGGKDFHPECKNAPICFVDFDCVKKGYEVKCLNQGTPQAKCAYIKAVKVPTIVLADMNSADVKYFGQMIKNVQITERFIPGMDARFVDIFSDEGKALIKKFNIKLTPTFILEKDAKESLLFKDIKSSYKQIENSYVSIPWTMFSSYYVTRNRIPGKIDFFLTAYDKEAITLLLKLYAELEKVQKKPDFNIHFVTFKNQEGEIAAKNGLPEIEESLRQLAILKLAPNKYPEYLKTKSKALTSSYWRVPIQKVGLDPQLVYKISISDETSQILLKDLKIMEELGVYMEELGVYSEFIILLNNQEVITSGSAPKQDLLDALPLILKDTAELKK